MISAAFELEKVEFGILIPGIPLPEKSQKEWGLKTTDCYIFSRVFHQFAFSINVHKILLIHPNNVPNILVRLPVVGLYIRTSGFIFFRIDSPTSY